MTIKSTAPTQRCCCQRHDEIEFGSVHSLKFHCVKKQTHIRSAAGLLCCARKIRKCLLNFNFNAHLINFCTKYLRDNGTNVAIFSPVSCDNCQCLAMCIATYLAGPYRNERENCCCCALQPSLNAITSSIFLLIKEI